MKIVVVEPHPDDAFLSVGWHLEEIWKTHERLIVTVFADDRRGKEAEAYAAAIGASSLVLGLTESSMREARRVRRIPALAEALEALEWDRILFPIGLQHPDHLDVAASRVEWAERYLDTPYQTKQKLAEVVRAKTEGMLLRSMWYPGARKWRHIPVFRSQAKFFHFNPMTNLRVPEVILCQSTDNF